MRHSIDHFESRLRVLLHGSASNDNESCQPLKSDQKSTLSHRKSRHSARNIHGTQLMMNAAALSQHFSQVTAGKIQMLLP